MWIKVCWDLGVWICQCDYPSNISRVCSVGFWRRDYYIYLILSIASLLNGVLRDRLQGPSISDS